MSTSATASSGRTGREPEARRHGVRPACDSERPTTVTHGQSWSLDGSGYESTGPASALVKALETSPKLVVKGRVELPTFRFSGWQTTTSDPTGTPHQDHRVIPPVHQAGWWPRRFYPYACSSTMTSRLRSVTSAATMAPSWSSCITTVALTVKSTRTLRPWAEGTNSGFHRSCEPGRLPLKPS